MLSGLAGLVPAAVGEARETLRPLITPILQSKESGDEGAALLSAALLCLPHVWSDAMGERERGDLQRIANLITSNARELSHSASLCLQMLMETQPLRHTAPLMAAEPAAPLFPAAPTTDVVRSVQRDLFALDDLRVSTSRATEVLLGAMPVCAGCRAGNHADRAALT